MARGTSLKRNSEFTTVYAEGRTWAGKIVVLRTLPNGLEWNRYGFVAGKRIGTAVVRNRVKRRLREVVRATPAKQGWDIVLIARARATGASYQELDAAVKGLLRRAQIMVDLDAAGRRREMEV
ncbi:MAG: ribonuclease P protein component [Dehalococcoidia bacterium]